MKLSAALLCVAGAAAQAQVFSPLPEGPPLTVAGTVAGPRPTQGSIVAVNIEALGAMLEEAPEQQIEAPLSEYGLAVALPGPEGELVPCVVARSPVMEDALQDLFPQIRTFIVQSTDGSATGRFEVSPRGITAMLRTADRAWMIDPWQSADPGHAVSYWLSDLPGGGDWECLTTEGVHGFGTRELAGGRGAMAPATLQTLRTVRLAMACTGEYGLYHSQIQGHAPNVADPLAAIVTIVGRSNVVYEADLAVHFNLIANNNQIIFFNPDTDPYDATCSGGGGADCSGNLLSSNINLLATTIGNTNFDIGHVVTRIYGGVAYLSAVCSPFKAGGVSGIPRGGDVDPFSALVVIHEMGHQFGANHTFSGTQGRCAGNVNLATAWEAGSGSSPMAYAGGCPVGDAPPTDNIAEFADPFFHHGSVGEMQAFLSGAACPAQAASGNTIPVIVSTSPSSPIPPGTPFVLSAAATDANGDVLTYSWEQYDAGVARPLVGTGSEDNGAGALFRAFPPVLTPMRTFPAMADVLSGVPTPGERLPTVTGATRQFRVIVRDNHAGAGGVAISSFVNLTVQAGTTPFTVTTPAQNTSLPTGENTVDWTVGGTNTPPISCSTVTVRLSTDDGVTFPLVLGTFPNTGAATVVLPAIPAPAPARIRVDANGKVFFAVSRPFVLEAVCASDYDQNGFVNGVDFDAFVEDFYWGLPAADVDHDGFVSGNDFDYFTDHFVAGC